MSIILILAGALFMYVLYYYPQYIAVLLFALIIANVNFDINALPLNSRAIITIALFGRIILDKVLAGNKPVHTYPSFLGSVNVWFFIIFMTYILLISYGHSLFSIELVKLSLSTVLSAYCVYHYFFYDDEGGIIKKAMIAAGLICFVDLAFTYMFFGSFPVQRLYLIMTGHAPVDLSGADMTETNHNFYGQICGMGFVFLFTDFIKNPKSNKYTLLLLPIMFTGVLMSTSRSALVAMMLVFFLIILKGITDRGEMQRVVKVTTFGLTAICAAIFLFITLGSYLELDSDFLDSITSRLIDEPMAILNRALGNSYNIQNLSSMDWRGEASADAYAAYMNLPIHEQLFGIGNGGFIARNLGHGLNPHNGILLILIENGLFGFLIYLVIIFGVMFQSIRLNKISPSFAVLGFILIYGVGQNQELTSITTFLFVYTMVAETRFLISEKQKLKDKRRAVFNSPTIMSVK